MKINNQERFAQLPDAFLFDTDNTLYPYDPAHEAAQRAVRDKVVNTFSISPEDFDKAFKEARTQVKTRLKNTASSHSRLLYLQRMLEIMGLGSQVLLALDFEQTYWRTFLSNATLFAGVKELLDEIRLLGIPTAIVTDLTAQIALEKMRPKGNCIWMIGDNPVNDIRGAREKINAVTLQKIHAGVEVGTDINTPDATFNDFGELRKLIAKLGKHQ